MCRPEKCYVTKRAALSAVSYNFGKERAMPGLNVDLKEKPPAAIPDIHLTKATKKSNLIREFP
jgi:hypothetical protein